MHTIKFILVAIFALTFSATQADIALPKSDKLNTKYYFANVDSFSNYTFFVRKTFNNKTYKLKQDAAFLLQAKDGTEQELEVWAVNNESKKESNSFKLNLAKPTQQIEKPTQQSAFVAESTTTAAALASAPPLPFAERTRVAGHFAGPGQARDDGRAVFGEGVCVVALPGEQPGAGL